MTLVRFNSPDCMSSRKYNHPAGELFGRYLFEREMKVETRVPSNILETEEAFRIELAVPGYRKEDINIQVQNRVLTVSAKQAQPEISDRERYTRREFKPGSFSRSFRLSDWVDGDSIEAAYEHGILMLTIPKTEDAKEKPAREIEIK